jgi:phosphinothricin acetyltransferase
VGKSVGFKHGRWVDIVHMQKPLNGGDGRAPDAPGITLTGH